MKISQSDVFYIINIYTVYGTGEHTCIPWLQLSSMARHCN